MTKRLHQIENAFPGRTRPLLMTALVVGDPFVGATRSYMDAVVDGGADIVELVMPFSDPAFHGPVMRRASARALSETIRWEDVEELVRGFRQREPEIPLIVTSYYNRVLAGGEARCVEMLARAGVDALMVMDLPFEEAGGLRGLLEQQNMALIQTVAPTTSKARFRRLVKTGQGFLVWTGHSGTEVALSQEDFAGRMQAFQEVSGLPVIASMDVESGPEAVEVARFAQGVLVGSSLAWLIEGKGPQVEERLRAFVADLRIHLDGLSV